MVVKALIKYKKDFPSFHWSFLGAPEEANSIPNEHKDQIHFLNEEGTELTNQLLFGSKMLGPNDDDIWHPFYKNYFKDIKTIIYHQDAEKKIKKWLFNLGMPFDRYVLVIGDRSDASILMTWKMVIKYCEGLFFAHDIVIFDQSLNWCLYYEHNDILYFGHHKIYDKEIEYDKALLINEILKKLQ